MGPTTSAAALPSPDAADPSDVSVALEAARALWENADTDEALRWFSRAAEAAEQAGNDRRALVLARAVADLKDSLATSARAVPSPPAPKSGTPPPPPSARKSSMPPPPSMRPRPPEAAPAKSAPPPPSMRPRPPEAAPARSTSVPPPLPQAKAESERPPAPRKVEQAAATSAPLVKPKAEAPGEESLRVSVKSSVRDPDLLIVRVLRKGQAVPSGCHEAFLSPAEHGLDLRKLRG